MDDVSTAIDDRYVTNEDETLAVVTASESVLANDDNPDGDSLTVSVVDGVDQGKLVLNSDGSFTYEPKADFFGTDTFTYVANDGTSDSNVATVMITVESVNDAPTFQLAGDQMVNDDAGPQTVGDFISNVSAGPANESVQTLSVSVSNDNDALFLIQPEIDLLTGELTFTPASEVEDSVTVTVIVSDDGGTGQWRR